MTAQNGNGNGHGNGHSNGNGSNGVSPARSSSGVGHTISRKRLPDERSAFVHKFTISGHEGYLHVGLFPDGKPGEIFIKMSKQGSTVSGLMDGIALLTSISLQYGVPLSVLVDKFRHTRFEPWGITSNSAIREATSILDYLFRYLALKFLDDEVPDDADAFSSGRPVADRETVRPEESIIEQALAHTSTILAPDDPTGEHQVPAGR